MSTSKVLSADLSITDLKALVARDLAAFNEVQARIVQLRAYVAEGKRLPARSMDLIETSNKDMTHDLVRRIELIEGAVPLGPTDREMLQVLNARLYVCDAQAMGLAELRELEVEACRAHASKSLEDKSLVDAAECLQSAVDEPENAVAMSKTTMPVDMGDQPTANVNVTDTKQHAGHVDSTVPGSSVDSNLDAMDCSYDEEWDQSTKRPLLYQILDIDPTTNNTNISASAYKALRQLSSRHNPKLLPNDKDAVERWAAILKAHEVLTEPRKRQYYDIHGKVPAELQDFDLARLGIS